MKKNLHSVLFFIIVCFMTGNLYAQSIGNYDQNELRNLRDFLIQDTGYPVGPYKNAQPKNYYCVTDKRLNQDGSESWEDDPEFMLLSGNDWASDPSWITKLRGVDWTAGYRIRSVKWTTLSGTPSVGGLSGILDLKACNQIQSFICSGANSLSELYLNGASLTGQVNVHGLGLKKFDIIDISTVDPNGFNIPSLRLSAFDIGGNNLIYTTVPSIWAFDSAGILQYTFDSQNTFVNEGGIAWNADIDLSDYYFRYSPDPNGDFQPTVFTWYDQTAGGTSPISVTDLGSGRFRLPDNLRVGHTIYCEMTNNFFNDGIKNLLTLRYETTVMSGVITDISTVVAGDRLSVYFSNGLLYVESEEIPIHSITVTDLSGKRLYTGTFNGSGDAITDFSPEKGVYVVKVTSAAGVFVGKVMNR